MLDIYEMGSIQDLLQQVRTLVILAVYNEEHPYVVPMH